MESNNVVIAGNRPYDGRPLFILIACITIAVIILIIFIVKMGRRKKPHTATIIILSILFLSCIGGIIFIGVGRAAKNEDIYIDLEQKISLNMEFEVKAYKNIDDLEITFEFKNKEGNILSTKVKKIDKVERNKRYIISVKLTEFSLTELININSVSAKVTGGRTSYLD